MAQPSRSGRFLRPKNRVAELTIDEVLPHIMGTVELTALRKQMRKKNLSKSSPVYLKAIKRDFFGYSVRIHNKKLRCFKEHGIKCTSCGLEADHFAIEHERGSYSLQLYGWKDGYEILFTKDHILPASLLGKSNLNNLQTMCEDCNWKKSNIIEKSTSKTRIDQIIFLVQLKKCLDIGVKKSKKPDYMKKHFQDCLSANCLEDYQKLVLTRIMNQFKMGEENGNNRSFTRYLRDEFEKDLGQAITDHDESSKVFGLCEFLSP